MDKLDVEYPNGKWYLVLQIEQTHPASSTTPVSIKQINVQINNKYVNI